MKKLYAIITALLLTTSICLHQQVNAQSPEKMSYQAVIRNSSNELVINQAVGMQISILQGTADGTPVYIETQTPTTNANGLVSFEIGGDNATVVNGNFSSIDWSAGTYFIKTETDPTGGTSYTITGTSQLLSVPYALHAKTAESVSGEITVTETDPTFTAWNKSTGISITESQISDLQNYLTAEVDPQFAAWDKATGIVITESQISDLQTYLTAETDPVYNASQAKNIIAADITNLGNLSGTNTGDETAAGIKTKLGITTLSGSNTGDQDLTHLASKTNVLELNNTTAFAPDADYEPATKKYVDDQQPAHYVGELYGGGIVFYVYNNGQNGLIASLDDLDGGSGVAWVSAAFQSTEIGAAAKSMTDGAANTAAIVAQDNTAGYAATLCNSYAGGSQTDWYLPASWELNLLYNSAFIINKILENDGNSATNGLNAEYVSPTYGRYWSSTEYNSDGAWGYNFFYGYSYGYNKSNTDGVRAVRAF